MSRSAGLHGASRPAPLRRGRIHHRARKARLRSPAYRLPPGGAAATAVVDGVILRRCRGRLGERLPAGGAVGGQVRSPCGTRRTVQRARFATLAKPRSLLLQTSNLRGARFAAQRLNTSPRRASCVAGAVPREPASTPEGAACRFFSYC